MFSVHFCTTRQPINAWCLLVATTDVGIANTLKLAQITYIKVKIIMPLVEMEEVSLHIYAIE